MLQYPPYNNFDDRIDRIALTGGPNAQAGAAATRPFTIAQVVDANPEWAFASDDPTGSAYIQDANAPTPAPTPAPAMLRPDLAAIKARLDGEGLYEGDPAAYLQSVVADYSPTGQMKADMTGLEPDATQAAFWDAQVRALTPTGALWNAPELGSELLSYALFPSQPLTPALLAGAASIAAQALRLNPGWYNSQVIGQYEPTERTTLRLLAVIGVRANAGSGA